MKIEISINLETQKVIIPRIYRNLAISATKVFFENMTTTAFLDDQFHKFRMPWDTPSTCVDELPVHYFSSEICLEFYDAPASVSERSHWWSTTYTAVLEPPK